MQPTSSRKKSTVRRLTPSQRTLRVLVCLVVVVTSLPLSVGTTAAEFTTEEWRTNVDDALSGATGADSISGIVFADGKVFVQMSNSVPGVSPDPGELVALDSETGAVIWNVSIDASSASEDSGLAVLPDEEAVFVLRNNGSRSVSKHDWDTGQLIGNNTAGEPRYNAIAADRNRNRLYAIVADFDRGSNEEIVELSPSDGSETGSSEEISQTGNPDFMDVNEDTGEVYVSIGGVGIRKMNAELTTTVWDNSNAQGHLDYANDRVFVSGEILDDEDGSTLLTQSTGGIIKAGNTTQTVYTDLPTENITELNQGDYSQIDTQEVFPSGTTLGMALSEERNEVAVFVGSNQDEVVRYNTDTITGVGDESLVLDVPGFMEHGDVENYEVTATIFNESREEFVTVDATDDANVTSLNTSLVTIDDAQTNVVATTDNSTAGTVTVQAEYENLTTQEEIAVAEVTVPNLDILPPWRRVQASLEDKTLQVIIVATMLGVAVSSLAGVFAGISTMVIVMIGGWIIEYVGDGMIIVTVITGMMIGMNVAGNVDYSIRR